LALTLESQIEGVHLQIARVNWTVESTSA
jgi:hypothetical protein